MKSIPRHQPAVAFPALASNLPPGSHLHRNPKKMSRRSSTFLDTSSVFSKSIDVFNAWPIIFLSPQGPTSPLLFFGKFFHLSLRPRRFLSFVPAAFLIPSATFPYSTYLAYTHLRSDIRRVAYAMPSPTLKEQISAFEPVYPNRLTILPWQAFKAFPALSCPFSQTFSLKRSATSPTACFCTSSRKFTACFEIFFVVSTALA